MRKVFIAALTFKVMETRVLFMDIKKEMGYKHLITQVQELWRMVSKN
jgi:hypothetical protein